MENKYQNSIFVKQDLEQLKELTAGNTLTFDEFKDYVLDENITLDSGKLYDDFNSLKEGIDKIYMGTIETIEEITTNELGEKLKSMDEAEKREFLKKACDMFYKNEDTEISENFDELSSSEMLDALSLEITKASLGATENILDAATSLGQEDIELWSDISITTKQDSLLLASIIYKASLNGDINEEYSKMPELIGATAGAQSRIANYCIAIENEEDGGSTFENIMIFASFVLLMLMIIALTILSTAFLNPVMELLAILALPMILELIIFIPASLLAMAAAALTIYGTFAGINYVAKKVLSPRFPKFKAFYNKIRLALGAEELDCEENVYEDDDENENAGVPAWA